MFATAFVLAMLAGCNDKIPAAVAPSGGVPEAPPPAASRPVTLVPWTGTLQGLQTHSLCALDTVNGALASDGNFDVAAGGPVTLEGWLSTKGFANPGRFTLIALGEAPHQAEGSTGISRQDVAKAYAKGQLGTAGYRLEASTGPLPPGKYAIWLKHEDEGGPAACDTKAFLLVK